MTHTYDAVVYGATEGGIAAAVTIAQQGYRVALVDELDYIGGMSAAGTTSMDGLFAGPNDAGHEADYVPQHPGYEAGFYKDFADAIRNHYSPMGKHVSTCFSLENTVCFEPSVAKQVFLNMLAGTPIPVQVFSGEVLQDVVKTGNQVNGFETKNGTIINYWKSAISLDGSDYGDLLAMTGVPYRVGKGLGGDTSHYSDCVSQETYGAVIRSQSAPILMTTEPPGYATLPDGGANTQTFEIVWGSTARPPTPLHLTPRSYFALGLTIGGTCGIGNYPTDLLTHDKYRAMPDPLNPTGDFYNVSVPVGQPPYYCTDPTMPSKVSKTNINWFNDYPQSVLGIEDRTTRQTENCNAKLRTIQFLYYLQNGNGMNARSWSVADEEGYRLSTYNLNHLCSNIPAAFKEIEKRMPLVPYVRESRRMVGQMTLSAGKVDSLLQNRFNDTDFVNSVGFSDYAFDLHGCWADTTMEQTIGPGGTPESFWSLPDGGPAPTGAGPAPVVFGALIPTGSTTGFLPANGKLISTSRVGNGKYRHQPISMIIGQAAGMIAAKAIPNGGAPAQVNLRKVQIDLLAKGAQILPFADIDNNYVYRQEANLMALNGIMVGYADTRFGINDPITRAQAAVVTTLSAQLPHDQDYVANGYFTDVPPGYWAYYYVEALKDATPPFTAGCGNNNYCPDSYFTRAQMAVFAIKTYEKLTGVPVPVPANYNPYSDNPPGTFYDYIRKLAWLGTQPSLGNFGSLPPCNPPGTPGTFCPNANITRGETAFVFSSILNLKNKY